MDRNKLPREEAEIRAREAMSEARTRQAEAAARQAARRESARKSARVFPLVFLGMAAGALVGHFTYGNAGRGLQIGTVAGFTVALVARLAR